MKSALDLKDEKKSIPAIEGFESLTSKAFDYTYRNSLKVPKNFYGSDAYISDYKNTTEFKKQFNKLIDFFQEWGIKNKCDEHVTKFDGYNQLKINFFNTSWAQDIDYQNVKEKLEEILIYLLNDNVNLDIRIHEFKGLCENFYRCSGGLLSHINNCWLRIREDNSIGAWLAELRTNIILEESIDYMSRKPMLEKTIQVHAYNGFSAYANGNGWNCLNIIQDKDAGVAGIDLDDLETFTTNFKSKYNPNRIAAFLKIKLESILNPIFEEAKKNLHANNVAGVEFSKSYGKIEMLFEEFGLKEIFKTNGMSYMGSIETDSEEEYETTYQINFNLIIEDILKGLKAGSPTLTISTSQLKLTDDKLEQVPVSKVQPIAVKLEPDPLSLAYQPTPSQIAQLTQWWQTAPKWKKWTAAIVAGLFIAAVASTGVGLIVELAIGASVSATIAFTSIGAYVASGGLAIGSGVAIVLGGLGSLVTAGIGWFMNRKVSKTQNSLIVHSTSKVVDEKQDVINNIPSKKLKPDSIETKVVLKTLEKSSSSSSINNPKIPSEITNNPIEITGNFIYNKDDDSSVSTIIEHALYTLKNTDIKINRDSRKKIVNEILIYCKKFSECQEFNLSFTLKFINRNKMEITLETSKKDLKIEIIIENSQKDLKKSKTSSIIDFNPQKEQKKIPSLFFKPAKKNENKKTTETIPNTLYTNVTGKSERHYFQMLVRNILLSFNKNSHIDAIDSTQYAKLIANTVLGTDDSPAYQPPGWEEKEDNLELSLTFNVIEKNQIEIISKLQVSNSKDKEDSRIFMVNLKLKPEAKDVKLIELQPSSFLHNSSI